MVGLLIGKPVFFAPGKGRSVVEGLRNVNLSTHIIS